MVAEKHDFHVPIRELFPKEKVFLGEVGIEIEIEGVNIPQNLPSYWNFHKEGSLRGEHAEFALKRPASRKTYPKLLDYFDKQLKKAGAECKDSVRTSVHVHLNMNSRTLVQCYNLVLCYLILEDLLTVYAGETRVGSVFCLRARDAEWFVDWMAGAAKTRQFNPVGEQMRYTSVNVCAIEKFNSVEFRALRGTTDMEVIKQWVEMLLALKDAAVEYETPQKIIADMSILGPKDFLKKLLPDHNGLIKGLVPNWDAYMWESARLVQEIAFATDWAPIEKVEKKRFFPVEADGLIGPAEPEWGIED